MEKFTYSREANYESNIILLDGYSGTGKSLFLDLLKSFYDVEISHFELIFDYLPILYELDPDKEDIAKSILKNRFDEITYNICTSRNINFRLRDISSVFKHPKKFFYLKSLLKNQPNDLYVENEIAPKMNIPLWTHSTSFNNDLYIKTFGNRLKIFYILRDPIYSVDKYEMFLKKIVNTPRELQLKYSMDGVEFPWYAKNWEDEFLKTNNTERSIKILTTGYNKLFNNITNNKIIDKSKVSLIFFENLVLNTDVCFQNIVSFLSLDYSKKYYQRLKIINKLPIKVSQVETNDFKKYIENKIVISDSNTNRLLESIKVKVNHKYFDMLLNLINQYYQFKLEYGIK